MRKNLVYILLMIVFGIQVCIAAKTKNPFLTDGNWYKANLHTHTKLSDGDSNLPDVVKKYRQLGYSVLAVTDHENSNDVSGYSDSNFLLLNGMETHPKCHTSEVNYHLVCLNLPNGFVMPKELEVQQRIDRVRHVGGEVIFAHPYWSGHNINQIDPLKGLIGIEVYNSVCNGIGKAFSSVHWDDLLQARHYLSGFATDDLHHLKTNAGGGWVMIKAKKLTPNVIMNSLKTGCFYSSSGPEIEDFSIKDNTIYLRCSPVKEIRFLGNANYGKRIRASDSEMLTQIEQKVPAGGNLRYIRAEIVDCNDKCAWTNPIIIPEKPKKK